MANEKKNEVVVLTSRQMQQKLAGYKSNYTKRVKSAKTEKERKALENGREAYVERMKKMLDEQNRKQIQRRAGFLSWKTRRANAVASRPAVEQIEKTARKAVKKVAKGVEQKRAGKTATKKCHSSCVGIHIISK